MALKPDRTTLWTSRTTQQALKRAARTLGISQIELMDRYVAPIIERVARDALIEEVAATRAKVLSLRPLARGSD